MSKAFVLGADISVVPHQLDIFMFDPANDAYLGRLCPSTMSEGKARLPCSGLRCTVFNKVIHGFLPRADILAPAHMRRSIGEALDDCGPHLICRVWPDPETARHRKSSETS